MKPLKINLLSEPRRTAENAPQRPLAKFFLSIAVFAVLFAASFAFGSMTYSETASFAFKTLDAIPLFKEVRHLISSPDRQLRGESDGRINIAVLGMGGEGHEGPYLTDTVIVASIRPRDDRVALLSIPRDLIVPTDNFGWRKINAINAFAEIKTPGSGGDAARSALEALLGIDIPYFVRVDFNGFEKFIDSVGGVDVYVDRSFADYSYPSENNGTKTVSFDRGRQRLTGRQALQFVRSRHGTSGEGSDFARARRQQKVLSALKEKLLSLNTFRNPAVVGDVLETLQTNVATNLQIWEILRLAKIGQRVNRENIAHKVIDGEPDSPLESGVLGGAYVLVPRDNDWNRLRTVAKDLFTLAEREAESAAEQLSDETAKIEIRNGTPADGRARTMAGRLTAAGFEVIKIGNADSFAYEKTVIYDLRSGKKAAAIAKIRRSLPDAEIVLSPPKFFTTRRASAPAAFDESTDVLIILGGNGS